jgi:hypothetical protein
LRNGKLIMVIVDVFFVTSIVINKFSDLLSDVVFVFFRAVLFFFRTQLIRTFAKATLGVSVVLICTSSFKSSKSLNRSF